jgi:UDP-N-acetylmuramoyl-L-alanyl-D-glutamate--2,6-diaminopimelate ligase
VLIAGKGHEDYQLIRGERLHFSDREAAEAAVRMKMGE